MKRLYLLVFCLGFMWGCEEKKPEPVDTGEITLSSESYGTNNYFRYGYSFEDGKFYQFPIKSSSEVPDIFLLDTPKPPENNLIGFISTETGNPNGIMKNDDFSTLAEAEEFYNSYNLALTGPWEFQSDTLEDFQVYTLRTAKNNYVKIMVLDVREIVNISPPDNIEIDIRYFIQRDGSTNLSSSGE